MIETKDQELTLWQDQVVTSVLTNCAVPISNSHGTRVRTLPCSASAMAAGEVSASWDGTDSRGHEVVIFRGVNFYPRQIESLRRFVRKFSQLMLSHFTMRLVFNPINLFPVFQGTDVTEKLHHRTGA